MVGPVVIADGLEEEDRPQSPDPNPNSWATQKPPVEKHCCGALGCSRREEQNEDVTLTSGDDVVASKGPEDAGLHFGSKLLPPCLI